MIYRELTASLVMLILVADQTISARNNSRRTRAERDARSSTSHLNQYCVKHKGDRK